MGKRLILAAVCVPLLSGQAAAGWYHVDNYEGTLGPYPIHFSLQTYDSFGSGITSEGSYFYDAKQSPIAIYGKASGAKLELCEIADAKAFDRIITVGSKTPVDTKECPFALTRDDKGATGTWHNGAKQYPVTLKKVADLDDTGDDKLEGNVAIPFWAQTDSSMFSGIYAKTSAGICMVKMQVIDKSSKKISQTIAFDQEDCNAGMVMTPIYMNVQKEPGKGAAIISVNFRDNRAGYTKDYILNPKTKLYSEKK